MIIDPFTAHTKTQAHIHTNCKLNDKRNISWLYGKLGCKDRMGMTWICGCMVGRRANGTQVHDEGNMGDMVF